MSTAKSYQLHAQNNVPIGSGPLYSSSDVDGDGDEDIINCNADWNTYEKDEHLVWYENPGSDSAAQKAEWKRHVIYEGSEFYSKPSVAVGDLDGDGLVDICVPTTDEIFYFRKTGLNPVKWDKITIPKDEKARWRQRPLEMVDLNADGKMDLVGMLIHGNNKPRIGPLPPNKAAVYLMTYAGKQPAADNWSTHVIKWGDVTTMRGKTYRGEKWDHCRFADVDRDGDLDIVANCEEHYDNKKNTIIGVVWFENPGNKSVESGKK